MTGIGGFLQEFLYGYSGLRLARAACRLDPSLTAQLSGVVLHGLAWHGRRFTVVDRRTDTTVTLDQRRAAAGARAAARRTRSASAPPLTLQTRRPDLHADRRPRALPARDGDRFGAGRDRRWPPSTAARRPTGNPPRCPRGCRPAARAAARRSTRRLHVGSRVAAGAGAERPAAARAGDHVAAVVVRPAREHGRHDVAHRRPGADDAPRVAPTR